MNPADEKLLSALGFAKKAGKVRSGELAAEQTLKSGKAQIVLVDANASEKTRDRWLRMCDNAGVPLVLAEDIGRAIGREAHMVACISDKGFAQMILRSQAEKPNFGGTSNGKE